ncbi:hypothetical protein FSP39_011761 [Pinctada imbricata]|uniref:BTB domain-containing protein n=1 Tax=Pinctada imbricata TaxID=66713 RepID=A0AA89C2D6_PINIB|nr:hypothetical protein FSP39_011761 [Pinctada imbricata]
MSEIVRLNVGGVNYTTTRATLCTYPDSMLGAMFSGNYGFTKDEHGCCFIDCDGTMFKHILAFLRSNSLILPQNFTEFDLLKNEAEFYQIQPLLDALGQNNKKEPKYLEIIDQIHLDSENDARFHARTTIIGRKEVLLEFPDYFGLDVEEEERKVKRGIHARFHETPYALACQMSLSRVVGVSMRPIIESYLYQHGWKLLKSTSSATGGNTTTEEVIHERWSLES